MHAVSLCMPCIAGKQSDESDSRQYNCSGHTDSQPCARSNDTAQHAQSPETHGSIGGPIGRWTMPSGWSGISACSTGREACLASGLSLITFKLYTRKTRIVLTCFLRGLVPLLSISLSPRLPSLVSVLCLTTMLRVPTSYPMCPTALRPSTRWHIHKVLHHSLALYWNVVNLS